MNKVNKPQTITVGEIFSDDELADMDLIEVIGIEDVSAEIRDFENLVEDYGLLGYSEDEARAAAAGVREYEENYVMNL